MRPPDRVDAARSVGKRAATRRGPASPVTAEFVGWLDGAGPDGSIALGRRFHGPSVRHGVVSVDWTVSLIFREKGPSCRLSALPSRFGERRFVLTALLPAAYS